MADLWCKKIFLLLPSLFSIRCSNATPKNAPPTPSICLLNYWKSVWRDADKSLCNEKRVRMKSNCSVNSIPCLRLKMRENILRRNKEGMIRHFTAMLKSSFSSIDSDPFLNCALKHSRRLTTKLFNQLGKASGEIRVEFSCLSVCASVRRLYITFHYIDWCTYPIAS